MGELELSVELLMILKLQKQLHVKASDRVTQNRLFTQTKQKIKRPNSENWFVSNVFRKCSTETVIHQSQSERKALSLASPRNNMAALPWPPPHTTNKHWTGRLSSRLWAWIENICASLASAASLSAVIWRGLLFTRASQCKYTFLEEHEFLCSCAKQTHTIDHGEV